MSGVLESQYWETVSPIVRVQTLPTGLLFVGPRADGGTGSPGLMLDPNTEGAACMALLNDMQSFGPRFTRVEVATLRSVAFQLQQLPGFTNMSGEVLGIRRVANLIEAFLRPPRNIELLKP